MTVRAPRLGLYAALTVLFAIAVSSVYVRLNYQTLFVWLMCGLLALDATYFTVQKASRLH